MGKHSGRPRLRAADPGYTGTHRPPAPPPQPRPALVCPACEGTRVNAVRLPCMRCAGTGLPDFRVAGQL